MLKYRQEKNDVKLVDLAKKDPENFEALMVRYQNRLFHFIKRISFFSKEDAEDILQEAFIKIYKNLNSFDDSLKFSTWAYQITRNCVIDAIRKKQSRPQKARLENEDLAKIFKSGTDIENETLAKDTLNKVKEIIDKLPFKYREVIILRFLEEKNYNEIMDIVKKPKGTIAALINRGRKMLAEEAKKQHLIR